MPNNQNLELVKQLREKVAKSKSIFFADYMGLNANDVNTLRQKIDEAGAEAVIAKNTLVKVALEEEGVDTKDMEAALKGPTAAIFSYEDAINPIKAIFEFAKKSELPRVKGGYVEGMFLDSKGAEELSKMPSKQELIARLLAGFNAPISGFVNALSGTNAKFVYALSAIAKKKSE